MRFPGCGQRPFAVGALLGIGISLENDVILNHGGYLAMLALLLKPPAVKQCSVLQLLPRDPTVVDNWRRQIEAFNAATKAGYVSDEAMPAWCTWDVFHRPNQHSAPQDAICLLFV